MKSNIKKTETLTLDLDETEVNWLKGILQNPLSENCDPAAEDPIDRTMRKAFWIALGGK